MPYQGDMLISWRVKKVRASCLPFDKLAFKSCSVERSHSPDVSLFEIPIRDLQMSKEVTTVDGHCSTYSLACRPSPFIIFSHQQDDITY